MKQLLRQRIIADRAQLDAVLRGQFSIEIARRIALMPEYRAARTVLGYMNFGAEFESDIWVRQALADGKELWLPKVNKDSRELDLYRVTDCGFDTAPGAWGIREPQPARCAQMNALERVDFILLPGVAFARDGARLGYGGGFYDKLLARMDGAARRPALVAGAYAMQVVAGIPQEPTDRKVEWLVTEQETLHCKGA
jgi:5,10-methenyltetrahydrofolate synthetase